MATLVLSAVGTAIGGPFGQALGALVGNQIDRAVFGGSSREGPRVKELSVTTSSYGQPIPRHFGRMRVAGSVIWATDLQETSESEGGKGQPSTTTYNYSGSFAVAISSTPIQGVGRIWADGNLLRGASGDLKVEGTMRSYLGTGDGPVDPLINADKGSETPAFRDCAYIVFEDLALADFGNRIPALTFEVFAEQDSEVLLGQVAPQSANSADAVPLPYARGFVDEGGSVRRSLSAINEVMPLSCVTNAEGVTIRPALAQVSTVVSLPEQLAAIGDSDTEERSKSRAETVDAIPLALRYYDEDLDYQPGVQRAVGQRPNGRENMVDLPATMNAGGARQLASANAQRARWHHERVTWRIGVLDPAIQPGAVVAVPDMPGKWMVKSWEWFDRGIELTLERLAPSSTAMIVADAGSLIAPTDVPLAETELDFFEVPPESTANPANPLLYAATTAATSGWRGAALYAEQAGSLIPIGSTGLRRSVSGSLMQPIGPSNGLFLEPEAEILIGSLGADLGFQPTTISGLAAGANRLLVGSEVIQFLDATQLGSGLWCLTGLLRGRGGSEDRAAAGHVAGTRAILLDNQLTQLDNAAVSNEIGSRIAAIGRGDSDAVYATLANPGISRKPLTPVHPRKTVASDGTWTICWTRRARGHWVWQDEVEIPLIEEFEAYRVGLGSVELPFAAWSLSDAQFSLSASQRADLVAQHGPATLWVQQLGTFAASSPLLLSLIS
ncbi:MAG: phage tail protein [Pseudomonadota bacterium]